jgi:hypothetical protein
MDTQNCTIAVWAIIVMFFFFFPYYFLYMSDLQISHVLNEMFQTKHMRL